MTLKNTIDFKKIKLTRIRSNLTNANDKHPK